MTELRSAGHDVAWVGDWPVDPGDERVLATAAQEGRVLVTLDRDFGELAIVHRQPHCGILRLVDLRARDQGRVCSVALNRYATQLEQGAIVTAEEHRVRVRPAETDRH